MKDLSLLDSLDGDYSAKPTHKQEKIEEPQVSSIKQVASEIPELTQKKRGRPAASVSLKDNKSEGAKRYINLRFSEEQYLLVNRSAIKHAGKINKLLTAPEYVMLALEAFMNEDLK